MRKYLILFSCLALFIGCSVSSINVLQKKETKRPYSKILTIYVDGAIEFSLFDSTTYNICLKSYFIDSSKLGVRSEVESFLYDNLSTPRSLIIRSSDLFDINLNSYQDFNKELDSLSIDAVLLVDHSHYHTVVTDTLPNYDLGHPPGGGVISRKISNAAYTFYLIEPHQYVPVWKASLMVQGRSYVNGKPALVYVRKLEKSLVEGGYIVPHR